MVNVLIVASSLVDSLVLLGYYSAYNYVVVGQICIKKGYRTSYNIFQRMYHLYKEVYNAKYRYAYPLTHSLTDSLGNSPIH